MVRVPTETRGLAVALATACLALLPAAAAFAGLTPEAKCEALKNKEAGKYAFCLQKAEMKLIKTAGVCSVAGTLCYRDGECPSGETCSKDLTKYNAATDKCEQKFSDHWTKWEEKAGGACPTTNDEATAAAYLEKHGARVADYLVGTVPLGDPPTQSGQTTCYSGAGIVIPCAGTGQDGEVKAGAVPQFADNADGTITDLNSGLMWEKKSDDGSIHDKDNLYTWSDALGVFVPALNSSAFAGYSDWRLPNAKELNGIVDYEGSGSLDAYPAFNLACASSCTVMACSCTLDSRYWSSTTNWFDPTMAEFVGFALGDSFAASKTELYAARAVRGGHH